MKALREKLMSHLHTIYGQRIIRRGLIKLLTGKVAAAYQFDLIKLISG